MNERLTELFQGQKSEIERSLSDLEKMLEYTSYYIEDSTQQSDRSYKLGTKLALLVANCAQDRPRSRKLLEEVSGQVLETMFEGEDLETANLFFRSKLSELRGEK